MKRMGQKGMGRKGHWIEIRLPVGSEPAELVHHGLPGGVVPRGTKGRSLPSGFVVVNWWSEEKPLICPYCHYNARTFKVEKRKP